MSEASCGETNQGVFYEWKTFYQEAKSRKEKREVRMKEFEERDPSRQIAIHELAKQQIVSHGFMIQAVRKNGTFLRLQKRFERRNQHKTKQS
jgi:hypothetical protein